LPKPAVTDLRLAEAAAVVAAAVALAPALVAPDLTRAAVKSLRFRPHHHNRRE